MATNLTLGKGELHFAAFGDNLTQIQSYAEQRSGLLPITERRMQSPAL